MKGGFYYGLTNILLLNSDQLDIFIRDAEENRESDQAVIAVSQLPVGEIG